jgi:hypothetical protein
MYVSKIMESQTIRNSSERLLSKDHPLSNLDAAELLEFKNTLHVTEAHVIPPLSAFSLHMPANSKFLDSLRAYTRSYFQPMPSSSTPRLPCQPPFNSTELALLPQVRTPRSF